MCVHTQRNNHNNVSRTIPNNQQHNRACRASERKGNCLKLIHDIYIDSIQNRNSEREENGKSHSTGLLKIDEGWKYFSLRVTLISRESFKKSTHSSLVSPFTMTKAEFLSFSQLFSFSVTLTELTYHSSYA